MREKIIILQYIINFQLCLSKLVVNPEHIYVSYYKKVYRIVLCIFYLFFFINKNKNKKYTIIKKMIKYVINI